MDRISASEFFGSADGGEHWPYTPAAAPRTTAITRAIVAASELRRRVVPWATIVVEPLRPTTPGKGPTRIWGTRSALLTAPAVKSQSRILASPPSTALFRLVSCGPAASSLLIPQELDRRGRGVHSERE